MKLSEAVRLGEFALEPVHGEWMTFDKEGKPCGGCAVGRAMYTAGYQWLEDDFSPMRRFAKQTWPWVEKDDGVFIAKCGCSYKDNWVLGVMSHLYECHHWSMTQIADWVETVEPQEQAESVAKSHTPVASENGHGVANHDAGEIASNPASRPLVEQSRG